MPDRGDELFEVRVKKREQLIARGVNPYPARFKRTHTNQAALHLFEAFELEKGKTESLRSEPVRVAGRITAMRGMGKASFNKLMDGTASIQAYLRKDILGAQYDLLPDLDLGDFLGVSGPMFRTRTGEVTVEAKEIVILSKALRPPPEKWHGLKDVEQRFRQRELDLMASEEIRNRFRMRSTILHSIRNFMDNRGFIEVETPILVPIPAGAMAQPFVTKHNALDRTLFLRIATELYLKRCVIGGLDKVYEIGRVFRNEGIDFKHNPEFTTMESYEAYADYHDVMEMVEEMVSTAAQEATGGLRVKFGDETLDFTPPWPRLNLRQAILDRTGIDITPFLETLDVAKREGKDVAEAETLAATGLAAKMREAHIDPGIRASIGLLVDKIVSDKVEPTLIQPTFLVDYPKEMSPLAKQREDDPRLVERFEGFAAGMEIANSFTELNDPVEQRARFQEQEELHKLYGNEDFDRLDEAFLLAMEHGMPPTGGLGVGIDRIAMLFAGERSIREVVLFPQLRT
ncbi:MAG: lysine--tRNA ligase [Dehalococcoidia bacterium]|nr:lysine--tRNA ligase [Dehalococcoidia bacterium]